RFAVRGTPRVSIVIPTGSRKARLRGRETYYLAACVESIRRRSTWPHYEIIAVDNGDMPDELRREMARWHVRLLSHTGAFNLSTTISRGAGAAPGEQLVLLNDDIEVIAPDWLECLLEYAQQQGVGAAGARLLFPDGRLQHVGVTVLDGNPGH